MKNEIVGEGTYGCVIKPALKCDKDTNITKKDYENRLSKVMRKNSEAKAKCEDLDKLNENIAKTKIIMEVIELPWLILQN